MGSVANVSRANYFWNFANAIFTNTSLGHRLLQRLQLTNFRHVYYLITPNETMVETIEEVPNYNAEVSAWWFTLIIVEYIILRLSGHKDRFALNDSITSVSAGMLSQCFKAQKHSANLRFTGLFNFDILEFGFFWGFHAIHHSSEYYNFSTALRQAALQDAALAIYDVAQAFFIPPSIFLVHRYFSEIYQFTLHTSLFNSYGPLGLVLNTPSHHRVHHGRNPYCIDRNYGGVFIIWDRMFGTFEPERKDEPVAYGLIKPEKTFNQIWLQFHILKELLFDKWRLRDEKGRPIFKGKEKLKAVVFPPGYFPGKPVQRFFHWWTLENHDDGVPQVEADIVKYNPVCSKWTKAYCLVHFIILLAVFFHFEFDRAELSYVEFTLKLAFFVCTMHCFGLFFDKSFHAPYMEMFRCFAVVFYYIRLMTDVIGISHSRIFMTTVFMLSGTFWLTNCTVKARKAKPTKPMTNQKGVFGSDIYTITIKVAPPNTPQLVCPQ